jgi:TPP-dependent pyruvate/acetoin dehydrogenase alpha subunit
VAVGHLRSIDVDDKIVSTHRGHGHCIAKGCDVKGMMLEIYGKRRWPVQGPGGSMHIADLDVGMLGANGIVGGGAPQAVGAALAAKDGRQYSRRRCLFRRWRLQSGHDVRGDEPCRA